MSRRLPKRAKPGLFDARAEWQVREVGYDPDHAAQLRAHLEAGGSLPPVEVVTLDDGALGIVDGFHRFAAHVAARSETIPYVIVGAGEDAVPWLLARANATHGLPRTTQEKTDAVRRALGCDEAADMSQKDLAAYCGVPVRLVAAVRKEMTGHASARAEASEAAAQRIADAEAAAPGASERDIADVAGVSKTAVHNARGHESARADSRPPTQRTEADRAKDRLDGPTWQERNEAGDRMLGRVTKWKREAHPDIEICVDAARIRDHLDGVAGAVKTSRLEECDGCDGTGIDGDDDCGRCSGRGFCRAVVR